MGYNFTQFVVHVRLVCGLLLQGLTPSYLPPVMPQNKNRVGARWRAMLLI